MYKLTRYEQETIILWNNDTDRAEIYTCDSRLKRKLQSYLDENHPDIKKEDETPYALTCSVPKKWVKVQKPRVLSEKQREKLRLRLNTVRENKKE